MEPHSENRGKLGGKFEDFEYTPRAEVWDRIAATPTDRPLGVKFRAFAWMPSRRVWRGIVAELHPQVAQRKAIIWWSAAASVVVLLGIGLLWEPGTASTADQLADSNWKSRWGKSFVDGEAVGTTGNRGLADGGNSQTNNAPVSDDSPNGAANGANGASNPQRKSNGVNPVEGSQSMASVATFAPALLTGLDARPAGRIARPTEETLREVLFWQTMENERRSLESETFWNLAIGNELEERDSVHEPVWIAQAGSNLSPGNSSIPMQALAVPDPYSIPGPIAVADLSANQDEGAFSNAEVDGENYRTPIVFGAYMDHPIGKGFAVSAGLVYSQLQSYVDGAGGNYTAKYQSTRQYLGFAANGTYSIPLAKRFSSYVSSGIQMDKGLGKTVSVSTLVGETLRERIVKQEDAGNYGSLNVGVGIRYQLLKRLSLYAQGNASYYFYHTRLNLWTNKTIWPAVQMGIRVNL